MRSDVFNMDCIEGMQQFPDKYFELAIVDPPYGINWMKQIENPNVKANWKKYNTKDWDNSIPNKEYFDEWELQLKNNPVFNIVEVERFI